MIFAIDFENLKKSKLTAATNKVMKDCKYSFKLNEINYHLARIIWRFFHALGQSPVTASMWRGNKSSPEGECASCLLSSWKTYSLESFQGKRKFQENL